MANTGEAPPRPSFATICEAANLMIKRHGAEAAIQAAMRVDEMLEIGDVDGAATWKAIMRAVEELQRETPDGSVH